MTTNYRLSRLAAKELEAIYRYSIEKFGLKQANHYMIELHDTMNLLAEHPSLGRSIDHIRNGYRRHEHAGHVIYYRQQSEMTHIMRVLGKTQDVGKHL